MLFRDKLNDDTFSAVEDYDFRPHFSSEASHGQHCAHGPKTNLKMSGRVLAFQFNSSLKIEAAMQIYVCDL